MTKIIFHFLNIIFVFLYIYPGSLFGLIIYGNKKVQPQLTPDFIISSNHFYLFVLLSIIGFFTYTKKSQKNFLIIYLVFVSIILESLHLYIPERSFQWEDLFGNILGVIVVILIRSLINKYGFFKK